MQHIKQFMSRVVRQNVNSLLGLQQLNVARKKRQFELLIETMKERKVDALALCDDEGRNSLR